MTRGTDSGGDAHHVSAINSDVLRVLKKAVVSSRERQSRSLPVLSRAYRSLKACPLAFTSLAELQQLEGFESDALLRSIAQWLEPSGGTASNEAPSGSTAAPPYTATQLEFASRSATADTTANTVQRIDEALRLVSGRPPQKRKATEAQPKTKAAESQSKSKAPKLVKTPKLYIPQPRTGSSGILVALFKLTETCPQESAGDNTSEPTSRHAKATIIEVGQPYSDSSYIPKPSKPGFGGGAMSFHSAWSGMKTLINRGYVYRTGNPARFSLSYTGWQVAKVCAEREGVAAVAKDAGLQSNEGTQSSEQASPVMTTATEKATPLQSSRERPTVDLLAQLDATLVTSAYTKAALASKGNKRSQKKAKASQNNDKDEIDTLTSDSESLPKAKNARTTAEVRAPFSRLDNMERINASNAKTLRAAPSVLKKPTTFSRDTGREDTPIVIDSSDTE